MDKCFAENKDKCTALRIKECDGCNFFKTKEEAEEGRNKAINRIKSLNECTRRNIIDTYYNGQLE